MNECNTLICLQTFKFNGFELCNTFICWRLTLHYSYLSFHNIMYDTTKKKKKMHTNVICYIKKSMKIPKSPKVIYQSMLNEVMCRSSLTFKIWIDIPIFTNTFPTQTIPKLARVPIRIWNNQNSNKSLINHGDYSSNTNNKLLVFLKKYKHTRKRMTYKHVRKEQKHAIIEEAIAIFTKVNEVVVTINKVFKLCAPTLKKVKQLLPPSLTKPYFDSCKCKVKKKPT